MPFYCPVALRLTRTALNNFVSSLNFVTSLFQVIYEFVEQHKLQHRPPRNNPCDIPLLPRTNHFLLFCFLSFAIFPSIKRASCSCLVFLKAFYNYQLQAWKRRKMCALSISQDIKLTNVIQRKKSNCNAPSHQSVFFKQNYRCVI